MVFLTPNDIESVIRRARDLETAWRAANIYLTKLLNNRLVLITILACHNSLWRGTIAYTIHTTYPKSKHEGKLIQHLGIISGICNECRLTDLIDRNIEQKRRKVSVGQAVQAMILNALGFTGRALYLTPRFYKNRPVDILVGKGLQARDLNDCSLGTGEFII